MKSEYTRLSRVEDFVTRLIGSAGVSGQIFVQTLPVTLKKGWRDMVLVDVGRGKQNGAYMSYTVNVFLYGRPTGDLQKKDAGLIDGMEEKFREAVRQSSDEHYEIVEEWCDSGYDTARNFHFNVVSCTVKAHE